MTTETLPLTSLQKQVISKKLDALRADYPVKAFRILMEDGTEWKVGEFPNPEKFDDRYPVPKRGKKGRPRVLEGKEFGQLSRILRPWVELAMQNPNEWIVLRPSDLEGENVMRCSRTISSMIGSLVGPGKARTRTDRNPENGEEAKVSFMYTGPAIAPTELRFWRNGEYHPEINRVTRLAAQPASQSDATNGANNNGI